jgi:hypothetical protein
MPAKPISGHEEETFFDMDMECLCRPSDLLIGDNVGHNFKHIETDFTPLQQRVMHKILLAKKKRSKVEGVRDKLQLMCDSAEEVTKEGQREITSAMRVVRQELARVEEQMRADLARVTAQNDAVLQPQINLCDSVLADLDEGVFLAKGYLEAEDPNSKPLSVVQSIEVGINEIVETTIPSKIIMQRIAKIDTSAVMARLAALKLPTEDFNASQGLNMANRRPAKAYERLHNLSVRKRVEEVNLKPIQVHQTICNL